MMYRIVRISALFIWCLASLSVAAQTTEFTYQGKLNDNGLAANASYDMQFKLYDAVANGGQVGWTLTLESVQVINGIFTVQLDFGPNFGGADRFIEIGIKPAGSPNPYTVLSPRQPITSAPYAIRASRAQNAAVADLAINSQQLGGIAANQYVLTGDARLSDARVPLPGSPNYIQNSGDLQTATFNISGGGTFGGTVSGGVVNAANEFRIGGNRILTVSPGFDNLFVGRGTGTAITFGDNNTFVGQKSGQATTTGSFNSFFGNFAGSSNDQGDSNSFFGTLAGRDSTASFNSFFGAGSGYTNSTGSDNSFFGFQSGYVNTTGSRNAFFGTNAGYGNTFGFGNSFFGYGAGSNSTSGFENTFIGQNAGAPNRGGQQNTYVGFGTGASTEAGSRNTLIGYRADAKSIFSPIENGTAIGAFARVEQNNSIVLGAVAGVNGALSSTNVGIGTTMPANRFNVVGDSSFIGKIGVGTNFPVAAVDIFVNGGTIQLGDAGCSPGFNGIGFAGNFSGCTNYSLLGNGTETIINRPTGGSIHFRENNVDQMVIVPFGGVQMYNDLTVTYSVNVGAYLKIGSLNGGGSTQICLSNLKYVASCSSSLRYKKDLAPFTGGLSVVDRLRPVTFKWKADDTLDLGFVAEDVAEIDPLLVVYNDRGEVEGVKYDRLSTIFVNAFKEQQAQIEAQRKLIERQQQQIDALVKIVCAANPEAEICREEKK